VNILFVTNNYKPYSGGVVSSIEAFRSQLKQSGHQVFVATLDFLGDGLIEPDVIRLDCPVRFTYRKNPMAIPFFIKKQLKAIFKETAPVLIHAHHPFLLGPVAAALAKEQNIPIVFTHHSQYGSYVDHYVPIFKTLTKHIIEGHVKNFCQSVNHIIAPTESVKKQLQAQNIATDICVIPTGILPIFDCETCPQKETKEAFDLLTVSRFAPEKNIPFLLDVMTLLDDRFKLTLIGFGSEVEYLKKYAFSVCKLDPVRIRFIERPPKAVIAHHYQKSDLFLFASTTETQGLVFAESMAAGTPVVAVKAPGAQDCVQDGYNGFLIDTQQEMAEKIELLAFDKKLYQKLHQNACETAKHYSIKSTTDRLLELYKELL
jgi:glycosyltransferase involved in cell wall biosynthesis